MSRSNRIIAVIILALVVSLFAGCQEPYDPDKLYTDPPSQEVCKEIHSTFMDRGMIIFRYNDIGVNYDWFYGTINGCIVAFYDSSDMAIYFPGWEIAGYTFEYGSPFEIYVYRDGEVCLLQEAYEKGWLTKIQIGKIYERHNELFAP